MTLYFITPISHYLWALVNQSSLYSIPSESRHMHRDLSQHWCHRWFFNQSINHLVFDSLGTITQYEFPVIQPFIIAALVVSPIKISRGSEG
jgi:hypothetical protein